MNENKENAEVQEVQMTEEQYAEFSKQLDLEMGENSNNQELTYFQEPILIEEETIIKNKNFKKGLEDSMKITGLFTGLVNGGISRELSEQYAIESVLLDKKLELFRLEQDSKNLENEFNII